MGVEIGAQTISITAAAFCGLMAGLLYDLLRVLRRGAGRAAGLICDLFFCLFCTSSLFLVGMAFCAGGLGVWEAGGFLGVFALYLWGVSPTVVPAIGILREKSAFFLKKLRKTAK